jgi:2,4-dienoyl-CoA reductase-like NADH-dependent reductase (Old Yellow Enzyme family)/thioredoxin reductase
MAKFTNLFKAGKFGKLKVKNRLVMPPMVRNYAENDGRSNLRYLKHIESIAAGGVGTMILEASYISEEGRGFSNQLGIHKDSTIPGLKKLARTAHKHKAAIGIQLYHAGRETSSQTTGMQTVAPSPIPDPVEQEMPHALTVGEIKKIIGKFGAGALRAKKAGMDFVEIHGAHGYLITQFLSPFSNKRTDEYGGSDENRFKFLQEVYYAVRHAVGVDFPVLVRLSGDELIPEGLKINDTIKIAKKLEALGADGLHISAGNYASYNQGMMIPPMAIPAGPLVELAAAVKKAVKIPVIAVAKIHNPKLADLLIKSGKADFIAIGRTLLADPEWPDKVKAGKLTDINNCIACNQGCISRLFAGKDAWCTVNPKAGREEMFAKKARSRKKVAVIGAGPGGLAAAIFAAERGHKVMLYEKTNKLGGQLIPAARSPYRAGWELLRQRLIANLNKSNVAVHTKTEIDAGSLQKFKYDAIILACGSRAVKPHIPGIEKGNVIVSRDLFENKSKAMGDVVIIGGGCLGLQTAEYLAADNHKVTLVEMSPNLAMEMPGDEKYLLLQRLTKLKVNILTETKVLSIESKAVVVQQGKKNKKIQADTIVACLGSKPNDELKTAMKKSAKKVIVVGDALSPRRVTEAIAEGALAALKI